MQIAVAMAHSTCCTATVEELRQTRDLFLPSLPNTLHPIRAEAGTARGCEAAILHLGKVGHFRPAAMVKALLGRGVKLGNMVGEMIHYVPIEATRLGEGIEQQGLIETSHHDDPIESLAVRRKADGAVSPPEEAPNLIINRRRGAPVKDQFRLAGAPPEIRGRKIEIGVRYRALKLEDALAGDKNQGSVGFDDLDTIHFWTVGGRILQKSNDFPLIFAQERIYSV
jgi:hypothetical protein